MIFERIKVMPLQSLKARLGVVFSGFLLLTILFSASLLLKQHRLAIQETEIATRAYGEVTDAISMREALAEIDREARLGQVDQANINRFRMTLEGLEKNLSLPDSIMSLRYLDQRFEDYAKGVPRDPSLNVRYEDAVAALDGFIEMHKNSVYRLIQGLDKDRGNSMKGALLFLFGFISLIVFAGNKIIAVITEPLSALAKFLDSVDLSATHNGDLKRDFEKFQSNILEVNVVAHSFEHLWERLNSYSHLNVKRLLSEKHRADLIASSTSDGILLLKGEEILYANPKAERILGLDPGTLHGPVGLTELRRGEENPGAVSIKNALVRTMPVEFTLEEGIRKIHYLISAFPIAAELLNARGDGLPADTIILAQDVTLVKESQEAKTHFLATLSHEVKTPVTSLTMAIHLLKKTIETLPTESQRSLVLTCVSDVDRLRLLLDELLTVSKFDTLTQKLEIKQINLVNLIKHSVRSFQLQASERGIQLATHVKQTDLSWLVPADPTKVTWTISNLLTNALRHTQKGGRVDVDLERQSDSVRITVKDTGAGIDSHRQARIFDKFNPYYDIRVGRSGSAGVGLAVAREFVQAHGGRIWVTSEPGVGSEFSFTLPLSRPLVVTTPEADGSLENSQVGSSGKTKGVKSGTTSHSG